MQWIKDKQIEYIKSSLYSDSNHGSDSSLSTRDRSRRKERRPPQYIMSNLNLQNLAQNAFYEHNHTNAQQYKQHGIKQN